MTTDFQCWGKALAESFFSSITKPSALSVKSGQARHQRVRPGVLTDAYVLDNHMISGGDSL
jgi:hypothetical protein